MIKTNKRKKEIGRLKQLITDKKSFIAFGPCVFYVTHGKATTCLCSIFSLSIL